LSVLDSLKDGKVLVAIILIILIAALWSYVGVFIDWLLDGIGLTFYALIATAYIIKLKSEKKAKPWRKDVWEAWDEIKPALEKAGINLDNIRDKYIHGEIYDFSVHHERNAPRIHYGFYVEGSSEQLYAIAVYDDKNLKIKSKLQEFKAAEFTSEIAKLNENQVTRHDYDELRRPQLKTNDGDTTA
jgi:L-rhamnose mutarotase